MRIATRCITPLYDLESIENDDRLAQRIWIQIQENCREAHVAVGVVAYPWTQRNISINLWNVREKEPVQEGNGDGRIRKGLMNSSFTEVFNLPPVLASRAADLRYVVIQEGGKWKEKGLPAFGVEYSLLLIAHWIGVTMKSSPCICVLPGASYYHRIAASIPPPGPPSGWDRKYYTSLALREVTGKRARVGI